MITILYLLYYNIMILFPIVDHLNGLMVVLPGLGITIPI